MSTEHGGPPTQRTRAESFGAAADEYERGRPSYPPAAVEWLLPPAARVVVDLGAGTGKLTRLLTANDLEVVAVEPSAEMRERLAARLPANTRCLAGRAEQIPLPDDCVDVVLVAQAWHWFNIELAVPEIARVLKPGGQLSLLWNIRDERVAWVAELSRILQVVVPSNLNSENPVIGSPFGPIERCDVEWTATLDPATLLDMVASRSYFITSSLDRQATTLDAVQDLLETHPQLTGSTTIEMPYVTRCSKTQLPR